jgi:hypothetical protein
MSEWHLIHEQSLAPKCLVYEYVTQGRHLYLRLCIYYDERGNLHPFGNIRLMVNSRKTYIFNNYKQLQKYLTEKGITLAGIEGIIRLWRD